MKIVVTSCCKLEHVNPQPVWRDIMQENPDVLILAGDNIYLDCDHHRNPLKLGAELRTLYKKQADEPHFKALISDIRSRGAKLLSIYDDHDFMGNNRHGGDNDPDLRDAARAELVAAFSPPLTGNDVYSVSRLGLIDIVILDERFYRRTPSVSKGDRNAILGHTQWNWFENIVADSDAKYLMVISSSTFHEFQNLGILNELFGESWEEYPSAFERMRQLLTKDNKAGRIIISGDIHRNDMYDDSGVMEFATSAVARKSFKYGTSRENYGVFTFDEDSMRVELRSLKKRGRYDFTIPLNNWSL